MRRWKQRREARKAALDRANRVPIQSGYSPRWVPTYSGLDIYTDDAIPDGVMFLVAARGHE